MHAHFRLTAGVLLSVAVFSFFVMQARSEASPGIATSTETASTETTGLQPAVVTETSSIATSTETAPAEAAKIGNPIAIELLSQITGENSAATSSTPVNPELFSPLIEVQVPQLLPAASTTMASSTLASSTQASSTPAANGASGRETPPPLPKKEFVLQPSAELDIEGNTLNVQIQIHNLSCRVCASTLKDTNAIAYYTAWYPNDGEIREIGHRMDEMSFMVSNIANWGEYKTHWSSRVPPGHYYFVIITDPKNRNNLYNLYRSEFAIQ